MKRSPTFQKALQLKPGFLEAQNNLAWVLATAAQAFAAQRQPRPWNWPNGRNQLAGVEEPDLSPHARRRLLPRRGRFDDAQRRRPNGDGFGAGSGPIKPGGAGSMASLSFTRQAFPSIRKANELRLKERERPLPSIELLSLKFHFSFAFLAAWRFNLRT